METIGNFLGGITNTLGQIGTAIGGQINNWLNPMNTPVNYGSSYGSGFTAPTADQIPTSTINIGNLTSSIGGEISNFLSNPLQNITNTINGLYGNMNSGFNGITNFINSSLGNMTSSIGNQFFGSVGNLVSGIDNSLGYVTQSIAPAIAPLTSAVNSVIGLIPQNIRDAVSGVVQGLQNVISPLGQGLSNAINNMGVLFTQAGSQQANQIGQALRDAQNANSAAFLGVAAQLSASNNALNLTLSNIQTGLGSGIDKALNSIIDEFHIIGESLNSWFASELSGLHKFITDKFEYATKQLDAPIGNIQNIYSKLLHGEYSSIDDVLKAINVNATNSGLIDAIIQILFFISGAMGLVTSIDKASGKAIDRLYTGEYKLELLSAGDYITLINMFPDISDKFKGFLHSLGLNDEQIDLLNYANRSFLSVNQLIELVQRGLINDNDFRDALKIQNYNDSDITNLTATIYHPIPFNSYLDNLRRGLYDDTYVSKFSLDNEKPGNLADRAKSLGLSEEDANRLYYASFTHPSIEQAKQMERRGLIDEKTYDYIIKYSGIAPNFIEPIKQLSFNLLTRRDIKALHSLGNITTQQVFEQYKKLGYDDNDAALLTDYTVKYDEENHPLGLQKSKVLSESVIKDAYIRRLKDAPTTIQELKDIGYSDTDSAFLLSVWDYDIHKSTNSVVEKSHTQRSIAHVITAFMKFSITEQELLDLLQQLGYSLANAQQELLLLEIDRNLQQKEQIEELIVSAYDNYRLNISQVTAKLTQFGFSQDEISAILVKSQLHRELKSTKISIADLDKMLKKQIIGVDDYQNQLRAHGYDEESVSWLSQLVGIPPTLGV